MESKRKKVLLFIDWYLPGYKAGGPVTSCSNMINALRNDLDFYAVTRNTDYCENEPYKNIDSNEWIQRSENEFVMYLSQDQVNKSRIKQIILEFDGEIIYINGIYSWFFSILPLRIASSLPINKLVIVAARGMLAQSAIGVKRIKKQTFLKIGKLLGWYKKVVFHATNVKEKEDIIKVFGNRTKVEVANNISVPIKQENQLITKNSYELRIISLARISPEKNVLLAIKALKGVEGRVTMNLYGQIYNSEYWNECQKHINLLPDSIKVKYHGMISPNEILKNIQEHHLLILPSLGENYGHVVAESFVAGRPVLISDQTPWKNLTAIKAGYDISVDDAEKWSETIQEFVDFNQDEYNQFQDGAAAMGKKISLDETPIKQHLKLFIN